MLLVGHNCDRAPIANGSRRNDITPHIVPQSQFRQDNEKDRALAQPANTVAAMGRCVVNESENGATKRPYEQKVRGRSRERIPDLFTFNCRASPDRGAKGTSKPGECCGWQASPMRKEWSRGKGDNRPAVEGLRAWLTVQPNRHRVEDDGWAQDPIRRFQ